MKKLIFAIHVAAIAACLATVGLVSRFGVHVTKAEDTFSQQAWNQGQSRQNEVRDLTIRLAHLNARYQMGGKAERGALEQELRSVAAARHEMLAALVESDPGEVLRVALPEGFGSNLPFDVQKNFEKHVDLQGELEVLYRESETETQVLYSLNSGNERLPLNFTIRPDKDLLTGTPVRVKGVRVGNAIALEGGANEATSTNTGIQAPQTLALISPNTFGEQKVLVLLVNFQDKATQPWTATQVQDVVFNQVNNFYKESSYQQTWLTGDVFGWYTLPISSATCDQNSIATYAKQAATAAGVNLAAYNRYVYAFPSISCGWIGWGTYGGNPSQAWIDGVFTLKNVGHELGHNFGLYHARYLDCGASGSGG